jgi:hypothetical protein
LYAYRLIYLDLGKWWCWTFSVFSQAVAEAFDLDKTRKEKKDGTKKKEETEGDTKKITREKRHLSGL